jgi:threonine/homoserine/homoserine lactone efflux protein
MIFFLISSFCIKLFDPKLCYFFASLIVLLFREQVSQANLGQFAFSFSIFFCLTSVFFVKSFFSDSIFFLSQSHIARDKLIKLTWVGSNVFLLDFL